MDSEIKVKSKKNEGSNFYFKLKAIEIFKGEPEFSKRFDFDPDEIDFKGSKVLVIDDIEKNRKLIRSFLRNYQLEIHEAFDGESGVQISKNIRPDLIFMDIRMPRMGGYQALKQIRRLSEIKHVPIIAVTASVHLDEDILEDKDGFNEILHKPVEMSGLLSILTQFLPFYKTEKAKKADGSKDTVDLNVVVLSDNLKSWMKKELDSTIRLLVKRKSNKVTKVLSEKLISIGEEYKIEQFVNYGENLSLSLRSFNIASLEKLTNSFITYYNSI